jgi:hypothetical protein
MDMGIGMWVVMAVMMGVMLVGMVAAWGKSLWRRVRGHPDRSNEPAEQ